MERSEKAFVGEDRVGRALGRRRILGGCDRNKALDGQGPSLLDGWWTDAGTFESLLRATKLAAETGANKIPGRGAPPRQLNHAE